MTLPIDDVRDLETIASFRPLVLDVPQTETYVSGADAIVRRVVGTWADRAGLLDLEGTWGPSELLQLRSTLARLAEDEDYVDAARVTTTLDNNGALAIGCVLTFDDGTDATFSVSTADAVSLNFEGA